MSISCYQLKETLPNLFTEIIGDDRVQFNSVGSPESAAPNSIVFVFSEKFIEQAFLSQATAFVVSHKFKDVFLKNKDHRTVLVSNNAYLALALTLQNFFPEYESKEFFIHPTAQIADSAKISDKVYIGPYCVIGENVEIGDNTQLDSHVVIEDHAKIGEHTRIFPQVFIGQRTLIGNHCEIKAQSVIGGEGFGFATDSKGTHHRIPQKGRVIIEDFVHIGSLCALDRSAIDGTETRIGLGTKMDNLIQVAHNVKIGKHCLLAGGTMIAGSTEIGDYCVIGGHCSIAGHIQIASKVQLGGRSGVTGSIDKPGAYAGYPIQPLRDHLKSEAYFKKLPSLGKSIQKLLKKFDLDS